MHSCHLLYSSSTNKPEEVLIRVTSTTCFTVGSTKHLLGKMC
jgi:hypothetical protein